MLKIEKITNNVTYIGALDPNLRVFDIVLETKYGSTYNSYLVDCGEEYVLIDTAKEHYFDEYMENLSKLCDISKIKYLIVNHTEPDHSGEIRKILEKFPEITIIGSPTGLGFLKDISNINFKTIEVKEDLELSIGNQKFSFVIAPNLHWPDSIFTILDSEKIMFTCDFFGAHYSTNNVYDFAVENSENYLEAFKNYYEGIFSPFKPFVKSGISKIKNFDELKMICPSHGPVLKHNLSFYKNKYLEWSKEVEVDIGKIAVVYVSAYGYTSHLAEEIKKGIEKEGFKVSLVNLLEKTKEEALYEINSSAGFLLGTPTLNSDATPPIWNILLSLNPLETCGKLAGAFGSFGWSGEGVKNIEGRLSQLKCEVFRPGLRIKFNPENNEIKLRAAFNFGVNFANKLLTSRKVCDNDEWVQIHTGKWKCLVCGEIYEGEYPPEECPACGAPSDQFVEVQNERVNYLSSKDERIFVIGSGIAAVSAIESIRKRNKKAYVEMISEESELPYYRILLSKKLNIDSNISILKDKDWFEKNNVVLGLGKKIHEILPNENKIIFNDNTYVVYDKLILALGARVLSRPIKGDDKTGVFYLRNKRDFDKITNYSKLSHVKKVIVVGGGILGVEMASSFKNSGKNVEIIEFSSKIMGRQLDFEASKMFENHLAKNGVNCITSEIVEEIYGTGENYKEVCAVKLLNSKETLRCEMVVIATGIMPNSEIAKKAQILTNNGIIVDKSMRTNFENIFACGDVAEFNHKNLGLWSIALEQGKVAGANSTGDTLEYYEKPISTSFNGFGYKTFSIGDLGFDPNTNYQVLELKDPLNEIYRKFFFVNNCFVGGVLMGDTSKAVQLRKAIDKASNLQNFLDNHFLDE